MLVHGAAGGVGTASIQVAKAFGAGRVIAVTSTPEKGEVATAAGADEVVLADGFKDAVKGGWAASTSWSTRSAATASPTRCAASRRTAGCSSSASPPARSPPCRSTACCSTTSASSVSGGAPTCSRARATSRQQWDALLPAPRRRASINPPVGATFGLDDAADALLTLDERRATGKVVLTP